MCIIFCQQVFTCTVYTQFPRRPERGVAYLGTGVRDGSEVPCRCGELNLHPLEEQQVLLTTELTLQRLNLLIFHSTVFTHF